MVEDRGEQRSADRWRVMAPGQLLDWLTTTPTPHDGVFLIGIDGRSRSGKTRLADSLASARPGVAVIHTDDIAWHHSFFDWTELLTSNVLRPLRRHGPPVSFRPRAWIERGRGGSIEVPPGCDVILVEGVGATRAQLIDWLDATVWVETPPDLAMRRTLALDRDEPGFVDDWMRAEGEHLDHDRPWTRATVVVNGMARAGMDADLYVDVRHRQ